MADLVTEGMPPADQTQGFLDAFTHDCQVVLDSVGCMILAAHEDDGFHVVSLSGHDFCSTAWPADALVRLFESRLATPLTVSRAFSGGQADLMLLLDACGCPSMMVMPLRQVGPSRMLVLVAFSEDADPSCDSERAAREAILALLVDRLNQCVSNASLEAENRLCRRQVAALSAISADISQLRDLDLVLKTIVERTAKLLDAEISYIALAYPEEQVVRVCVTHGAQSEALERLQHRFGEGVGGRVAATGTPLLVSDWFEEVFPAPVDASEILVTEGIISAICVPMATQHGLIGVLYAASRRRSAFTHAQLHVLQSIGMQAAIAIENARLFDEERSTAARLQENTRVHERFLGLVLRNEGLQAIADALGELVCCPVIVEDDHGRVLCCTRPAQDHSAREFELAEGLVASSTAEVLLHFGWHTYREMLEDAHAITWLPGCQRPGAQHPRVVAPIVAGGDLLGYVSAIELDRHLDAHQHTALEQAAIVVALEFKKQQAARSQLVKYTLAAQENERIRIARELHDETSQATTALMMSLDTAKLALSVAPDEAVTHIENARNIAEALLDGVRRLSTDLRPSLLDDLGLVPALAWYGETRLEPLGVELLVRGNALDTRLPAEVETALFRVVQEALTNVLRYAEATAVILRLDVVGSLLQLEVSDDGRGFDARTIEKVDAVHPTLGLWGMRERATILGGDFSLQSAPGKGTAIRIEVPLDRWRQE